MSSGQRRLTAAITLGAAASFDKALAVYGAASVAEDDNDAEAHWVLCAVPVRY